LTEPAQIRTESIEVRRTALVAALGPQPGPGVTELWYVLHGQGMRAVPFLEDCRAVASPARLILAPEGLSRYYEGPITTHKNAIIGASWMTRDERESEIRDYVRYLDDLHASMKQRFGGTTPPVTVIGFSQGGATATRWVAEGNVKPARLVIWASSLPPEMDYANNAPLRAPKFTYVCGTTDMWITPKVIDQQLGMLTAANLPHTFESFVGGHRLDDGALQRIAAG
jgi:predicted esterase